MKYRKSELIGLHMVGTQALSCRKPWWRSSSAHQYLWYGVQIKIDNIKTSSRMNYIDMFVSNGLCLCPFWKRKLTHIHTHTYPYTCHLCLVFSTAHYLTASLPIHVITTRAWKGGQKEYSAKQKISAWNSFSSICTRALHSFRSFAHCLAASTVIPMLPKATITLSIQPNLGLPRTRPPLTSAINTLLEIRCSSILSTWWNLKILNTKEEFSIEI